MNNQFEPAAIDEGRNSFRSIDDDNWAVEGYDLRAGQEVTVTKKDGEEVTVIITEIIEEENQYGLTLAKYEWLQTDLDQITDEGNIIYRKLEDGSWGIQGYDLQVGTLAEVVTKKGEIHKVKVEMIVDEDDDGLMVATFTRLEEYDNNLPVFRRDPSDPQRYLVQGKNLHMGEEIVITTRKGKKVSVTLLALVQDNDGIQLWEWEENDS
ncbi:MAG: hypothetical protein WBH82_00555 [Arcanobacterium sp.]